MVLTAATKAGGRRIKSSKRRNFTTQVLIVDKNTIRIEKISSYKLDDRCKALLKNGDHVFWHETNGLVVHRTNKGSCLNLMNIGLGGVRAVIYRKNGKPLTMADYAKWNQEQKGIVAEKMIEDHKDLFWEEEERRSLFQEEFQISADIQHDQLYSNLASLATEDNIVEIAEAVRNVEIGRGKTVQEVPELPKVPNFWRNMKSATADSE